MQELQGVLHALVPDKAEAVIGTVSGTIGAFFTLLFGGWTDALVMLIVAMGIDFVTGMLAAAIQPTTKFEYSKGVVGIGKKTTILLIVALGHVADMALGTSLVEYAVIYAYLAIEAASIIGNAEAIGVPVPNVIKMAYTAVGDKGNEAAKRGGIK